MTTLDAILQRRKWYDLRALAGAYGLPFSGRKTRQEEARRLSEQLIAEGCVRRQFRQLNAVEREPLVALQVAGGQLPRDLFIRAFGEIRRYRPWRGEAPRHPWKQPISRAEKLWFLAFIDIQDDRVVAPTEVLAMLPPPPRVVTKAAAAPQPVPSAALLLVDLAILIGCLLYEDVKPLWGRWLPPRFLKRVNAAVRSPEDMAHCRSELQAGRLRFLHHLAEVAGLISVQTGYLKPTPAAWVWLDLTPEQQWQQVWVHLQRDLESRAPLWNRYRLPPTTARIWGALTAQLQSLPPNHSYDVMTLMDALRPHVPGESLDGIPGLLGSVCTWLGAITLSGSDMFQFHGLPPIFPALQTAVLQTTDQGQKAAITLHLPVFPRLRPLVELMACAALDDTILRIDAEAVRRAGQAHQSVVQFAETMTRLIGSPVSEEVFSLLHQWERQAHRLTLRHQVTLTSADSDLLASLLADRYLRPLLDQPLSAHHIAVKPHAVDQLARALARRDLPVTDQRRQHRTGKDAAAPVDSQTAACVWLAVRVYQGLGQVVSMPVHIPGAVLEWLETWLAEGQRDWLEQTAQSLAEALARAIANEPSMLLAAPVQDDDPATIRTAVERAYADRCAITIDYFSPAQGMLTRRTIEPMLPIIQRGDFAYIEAWCQEAEDTRTFRLDRVVRVIPSDV
ncbi:MAG: WYL domain-containing protein [Anaerolineae bacterium]|nr:WYL domain-containing protein [Anaerolineae bacterium]